MALAAYCMGLGDADGPSFEGVLLRYNHFGRIGHADVSGVLPYAAGGGGQEGKNEIERIGDLYENHAAGIVVISIAGVAAANVSGGIGRTWPCPRPYIAGVGIHQHVGRIDATRRNAYNVAGNITRLSGTCAGQFASGPAHARVSRRLPSCIGNKVIGVERAAEIDNSKQEHQHYYNSKPEFQERAAPLVPGFDHVSQSLNALPNMYLPGYPHLCGATHIGKRWQTRIRK
jgi:hypothetical protein